MPKNKCIPLTILIPCLNEEDSLAACIKNAKKLIKKVHLKHNNAQILVADNGSTDNSVKIAKKYGADVIHTKKKGYGANLQNGINHAKGEYIIMGDADGSYDFAAYGPKIYKNLMHGADLAIGNRFAYPWDPKATPASHRFFGVPALSLLGRICYGTNVKDFHCGLRGFKTDLLKYKTFYSSGMDWASEMIGWFAINGKKIKQSPVRLKPDLRNKKPHLLPLEDGLAHIKTILITAITLRMNAGYED